MYRKRKDAVFIYEDVYEIQRRYMNLRSESPAHAVHKKYFLAHVIRYTIRLRK